MAPRTAAIGASEGADERRRLLARASTVGAGTLLSRFLGLLRDLALAALFDRDATDAWWAAFTIPNALRQLLAEGVVSGAVVPLLSEKLATDGDDAAARFFARVRGASVVALAIVTVLGVVFAHPITLLFAGGYRDRPGELERTVTLTRLVFPYIAFIGTAALGMAALNAKRRFVVAAFTPGLLNVAMLAAAFTLPALLSAAGYDPVIALAIGALLGGLLQVAAQWPALRAIGFAGAPQFVVDDDVRRVFRRIGPLTVGIGIYAIDLVVARRFLSGLGIGAQSYFMFASRLCDFPQGIFVMALSTAALPSLSAFAARGERAELAKTWAHGLNLALFAAVPTSVALVALGEPLVVTLFQRGEFDRYAAHETARAVLWQGAAIWTVAVVRQTVSAFHALGDTRTPVLVSAIDLSVFIALAFALSGPLRHVGISIAVAASSTAQMALLVGALRVRLGREARGLSGPIARSAARTLLASAVAGVAGWEAARLLRWESRAGAGGGAGAALGRALPGVAGGVAFALVFLLMAWALRAPELAEIASAVRRRLGARNRGAMAREDR